MRKTWRQICQRQKMQLTCRFFLTKNASKITSFCLWHNHLINFYEIWCRRSEGAFSSCGGMVCKHFDLVLVLGKCSNPPSPPPTPPNTHTHTHTHNDNIMVSHHFIVSPKHMSHLVNCM